MEYRTRLSDDVWRSSWADELTKEFGPQTNWSGEGYVWGTNLSAAYPGFQPLEANPEAALWQEAIEKPMFCAMLETDRFRLTLVFHDVRVLRGA